MTAVRLISALAAIGIVALVLVRSDFGELWRVVRGVDLYWLLPTVLLNLPILALATLRSFLVLRSLGRPLGPQILLSSTVVGYVAGALTPAASGELLRADALRHAGVPMDEGVALVVYERALSVALLALSTAVLAALIGLPLLWGLVVSGAALALAVAAWLAAVAVLPLLPGPAKLEGGGVARGAVRYLLRMAEQLRVLAADRALMAGWSLLTMALFALAAAQFALLARSVSGGLDLSEAWLAFGASQLAGIASLLPLGLGVADGSLAAVLHRLGTTLEQGSVVAVLVRATITLPLVLVALACYLYLARTSADGRRAGVEPQALRE